LGNRLAREGDGKVREQTSHSIRLQEQTLLEEERAGRGRQGTTAGVLSSQPTDRPREVSAQQRTCPRVGSSHGSGTFKNNIIFFQNEITICHTN